MSGLLTKLPDRGRPTPSELDRGRYDAVPPPPMAPRALQSGLGLRLGLRLGLGLGCGILDVVPPDENLPRLSEPLRRRVWLVTVPGVDGVVRELCTLKLPDLGRRTGTPPKRAKVRSVWHGRGWGVCGVFAGCVWERERERESERAREQGMRAPPRACDAVQSKQSHTG